MARRYQGLLFVFLLGVVGCGPAAIESANPGADCDALAAQIQQLEKTLFNAEEELEPNQNVRSELMRDYAAFANACHDDIKTAEMLFRRADLLRSAGKFQEAMTQLRDVHDHFPEYEKRAISAFLVGFIAEVELNDREQAKKTYEQVIALHDSTDAAEWARQSLLNLEATTARRNLNGYVNDSR
jgi:TolA-binding protein